MIDIKIDLNNAQQGWYRLEVLNSNKTKSEAKLRLTKKDFRDLTIMLNENENINLTIYTWKYVGYYERDETIINIEDIIGDKNE